METPRLLFFLGFSDQLGLNEALMGAVTLMSNLVKLKRAHAPHILTLARATLVLTHHAHSCTLTHTQS